MNFIANKEPIFRVSKYDLNVCKVLNILTFKKSKTIKKRIKDMEKEIESLDRGDVY